MDVRRVAGRRDGMMGAPALPPPSLWRGRGSLVSRSADGAARGGTRQGLLRKMVETAWPIQQAKAAQARFLHPRATPEGAAKSAQLFVESTPRAAHQAGNTSSGWTRAARPDTILCSNTSGISITEIAARCRKPRGFHAHFWNPPYIMPLVEVVVGKRSDIQIAEEVVALLKACGKVRCSSRKDVPGQLGNRIKHAMIRSACNIVPTGSLGRGRWIWP